MFAAIAILGLERSSAAQSLQPDIVDTIHAASRADAIAQHGVELRREHRDDEALKEFERAHALKPQPRTRAQIALAEQALGRWTAAETDLLAALEHVDDPWIASNRAALETSRVEIASHLATVRVVSNVESARLRIGEGPPVALPCALRVEAGLIDLHVEVPGQARLERTRTVLGGTLVDEEFVFATNQVPGARLSAKGAEGSAGAPPDGGGKHNNRGPWSRQAAGLVLMGASVGPLTFGIVESLVREHNAIIYDDNETCPPAVRAVRCEAQRRAAENATVFSVGAYATAATLVGVGSALFLLPALDGLRVVGRMDEHGWGVSLLGRF